MDLDPVTVQKWLNDHSLSTDLLISTYTEQIDK